MEIGCRKKFSIFLAAFLLALCFLGQEVLAQSFAENYVAAPQITSLNQSFLNIQGLSASGKSDPFMTVWLTVAEEGKGAIYSIEVGADKNGNWSGTFEQPLKKGYYYIEALAENNDKHKSSTVRSNTIWVRGPFSTIMMIFSVIVVLLTAAFTIIWYLSRQGEIKRYHRILLAQRDMAASYNVIKSDVLAALRNYATGPVDEAKSNEIKFLLERIDVNLEKMNKYVIQGIKVISNYDIIKKVDKSLREKTKL